MCGYQLGLGDRIGSFGDGTGWYVGVMAVIWAKCLARILVFLWGGEFPFSGIIFVVVLAKFHFGG